MRFTGTKQRYLTSWETTLISNTPIPVCEIRSTVILSKNDIIRIPPRWYIIYSAQTNKIKNYLQNSSTRHTTTNDLYFVTRKQHVRVLSGRHVFRVVLLAMGGEGLCVSAWWTLESVRKRLQAKRVTEDVMNAGGARVTNPRCFSVVSG